MTRFDTTRFCLYSLSSNKIADRTTCLYVIRSRSFCAEIIHLKSSFNLIPRIVFVFDEAQEFIPADKRKEAWTDNSKPCCRTTFEKQQFRLFCQILDYTIVLFLPDFWASPLLFTMPLSIDTYAWRRHMVTVKLVKLTVMLIDITSYNLFFFLGLFH